MKTPLVSIVIPAFNEEKVITNLLVSIKKQSYQNIETIVVDDASTDTTSQISTKLGAIVYTRTHAERSVQRNYGANVAKGEYLLFLDADMELEKDVIYECINMAHGNKSIGAVVIPEVSVAKNYWEMAKAFERSLYNKIGDSVTDAARFFTRDAFLSVGGYDESLTGPEDWDLPETIHEKGYKIGRISKSKILHHERVASPYKVAKKKYYYALTSYKYFQKHKIPIVGSKSIYFLRPVFYKNWKTLCSNPKLTLGMLIIVTMEQIFGTIGYFQGMLQKK